MRRTAGTIYRRYEGYTGRKVWRVSNPEHGMAEVLAPSWQAAIVVAAQLWGTKWTACDFYANCTVTCMGMAAKEGKGG